MKLINNIKSLSKHNKKEIKDNETPTFKFLNNQSKLLFNKKTHSLFSLVQAKVLRSNSVQENDKNNDEFKNGENQTSLTSKKHSLKKKEKTVKKEILKLNDMDDIININMCNNNNYYRFDYMEEENIEDILLLSKDQEDKIPLFMKEPFSKSHLVKGSFKTIVQLPKSVNLNEWLALNMFDFFCNLNLFYDIIKDYIYVTDEFFRKLDIKMNYLWIDTNNQLVLLTAPQYVECSLEWISNKINDQLTFPTKNNYIFPPNFSNHCKGIAKQIFIILTYTYYCHFEKIIHLSLESHWNSFFAHFINFVKEFELIGIEEMKPLSSLIRIFEKENIFT